LDHAGEGKNLFFRAAFSKFRLLRTLPSRKFPAMRSLRTQLLALLVAFAFVFGWAHCALDLGCTDEATPACQLCWCHSPAVPATKAPMVKPADQSVPNLAVILQPNARAVAASIFNPPKA
jgi:hypothetical protein